MATAEETTQRKGTDEMLLDVHKMLTHASIGSMRNRQCK